ncbi:MAG: TadE/TadG family type IV pilus assembly protein [Ilumatobacteraceae bacterium]
MTHEPDSGQATVEFALVLPLALMCLALVIQLSVIVSAQTSVHHDARLAARTASMSDAPAIAAESVVRDRGTEIEVTVTDLLVTVDLRRRVPIVVPLVGGFLPSIDVRSRITMALEPPIHTDVGASEGGVMAVG